jgi:prepilin signal peptidase PulO-like enzyme (type II secretory pathway)
MSVGIPLFCGAATLLFKYYGYEPVKLTSLVCLMAGLMVTAMVDKQRMIIPNEYLAFFILIWMALTTTGCIYYGSSPVNVLIQAFFGALLGVSVFVLARVVSPKSIGMGDIKLFAVLGIYFGTDDILRVMLASLIVAAAAGIVKVFSKKLGIKEAMCMGPYIAVGTLLVMVLGV